MICRSSCLVPLSRFVARAASRAAAILILSAVVCVAAVSGLAMPLTAHADETAICYNCPPEWADWASQIKAIQQKTGIRVPFDNKNSGQSIAQLMAEQKSPVADVVYLGVSSAFQAKDKGVIEPYRPAHWNDIPANLKDPQGYCSPSTPARSASSSTRMRSKASPCRVRGPICSSRSTRG